MDRLFSQLHFGLKNVKPKRCFSFFSLSFSCICFTFIKRLDYRRSFWHLKRETFQVTWFLPRPNATCLTWLIAMNSNALSDRNYERMIVSKLNLFISVCIISSCCPLGVRHRASAKMALHVRGSAAAAASPAKERGQGRPRAKADWVVAFWRHRGNNCYGGGTSIASSNACQTGIQQSDGGHKAAAGSGHHLSCCHGALVPANALVHAQCAHQHLLPGQRHGDRNMDCSRF